MATMISAQSRVPVLTQRKNTKTLVIDFNMEFRLLLLGNGLLLGWNYYPLGETEPDTWGGGEWSELNVYLIFLCLHWKWFHNE